VSHWIDIQTRRPKPGEVWVKYNDGSVGTRLFSDMFHGSWESGAGSCLPWPGVNITHWQKIVEPKP
jgi:hypothetical protein